VINWQKGLASGLIACLLVLPIGDLPISLTAKAPRDAAQTKQTIAQYGVGANIEVTLKGDVSLRGPIQTIEDEAFTLLPAGRTQPTRIAYDQVDRLDYAGKYSYKASGQPDPDLVRRVVVGWGTGRHIKVKLTGGTTLLGDIRAIEQDHFTLATSAQGEPVKIAYSEVQQVKGKMRLGTKLAIAAVPIAVGAVLLISFALAED
jgi:ribosome maturation factor RimP